MTSKSTARILLVDDEPHVLDGLRRMLRSEFTVDTAAGPGLALARIADSAPFAVIVSDFQMPQMNGAKFLAAARAASPDSSRILLTGQADLAGAASVVNEGGILRLMLKPAGREELLEALQAGIEAHRLITAERDLLDNTLRGCVRALTEVLGLANPQLFARADRLRNLVTALGRAGGIPIDWHVELAAMLADVGAIAIAPEVLARADSGEPLTAGEQEMIAALPAIADQLLGGIPRIDEVRAAILSENSQFDGSGAGPSGEDIPLGGRLLRIARDFDRLEVRGTGAVAALASMRAHKGCYDPTLLDALAGVVADRTTREPREMALADLRPGMVLASDVLTLGGLKLIAKGNEINPSMLARIRSYAAMASGVETPVLVFVPDRARELVEASSNAR